MKQIICSLVAAILLIGLLLGCAPAAPKQIVLKNVTFLPKDSGDFDMMWEWIKRVEERSNGEITFEYVGGPEAITGFDQIDAVMSGVVDVACIAGPYYAAKVLPEVDAFMLSELMPWEERQSGFFDLMAEAHKEKNLFLVGNHEHASFGTFHLFLNRQVTTIEDFEGLKIRTSPMWEPFVKALGASPVTTSFSELYTAVQQGMVDGFGWNIVGPYVYKWYEITEYLIEPGVYGSNSVPTLINLDTWNSIPKNLQQLIIDVEIEIEREMVDYFDKIATDQKEAFIEAGNVEVIQMPAERWVELAYDSYWASIIGKTPVNGPKLRELCSKK